VIDMPSDPLEAVAQLDAGRADAVVLQAWMVDWLGMLERVTEYFDTDQMIPAPGQAALAVEVRDGDEWSAGVLSALNDADTAYAVMAERACAARLRSAPRDPVGVFAITDGQTTFIHGIVATIDGTRATRLRWSGPSRSPVEVGDTLAELLESLGALDILAGGPLPPSIRYADRRRQLIEEWGDQDGPDA
jgi:hydroxymethylbilane synthase